MKRIEPPFTIRVDAPCCEDWQQMSQKEQGRFCQRCRRIVVDFSNFSDKELLQYLQQSDTIPCGRFHQTQLNRIIGLPPAPPIRPLNTAPVAAAVFMFLGLQLQLQAASDYAMPSEKVSEFTNRCCNKMYGDSLRISGTVRDPEKKPLVNAEISFNGQLVQQTDSEGRFSFIVPGFQPGVTKKLILVAGYPGYINAVRNYHPAMGSTSFDITLYEPAGERTFYTMGVPYLENRITPVLLSFKKNQVKVQTDSRAALAEMAFQMKNNPATHMLLVWSGKAIDAASAEKFSTEIIRILTEEEGISAERFKTEKSEDPAHKPYTLHIRQERFN